MRKYKKVKKTAKEIKSIQCDFCGKKDEGKLVEMYSDITNFSICPGYGSKYDTDKYDLDICDKCLTKLLNKRVKK